MAQHIILSNLSKSFGSRVLFDRVDASFQEGNRYGLTGPNGSGKSTLMKIIKGEEEATSGSVILPKRVGMLRQNIEAYQKMRVLDAVIMGNQRLWNALQERDRLYGEEITDEVGMRLGELEEVVVDENGYNAESDAAALLSGMGMRDEDFEKKMGGIPTDLQFRVLLCQALFGNPQALLLDEPTNHLDLESIGWLERFLHEYSGILIVISHDRHFLNSVCTHIADIDYDTIIVYTGNYDDMILAKTSIREQTERDAKSKEKKIAQLKEFVARFGAGTRASQVQSRLREIDRLQPQKLKESNIQRPYIRFQRIEKQPGKLVLKIGKASRGYGAGPVISNFSLEIERGDKIGVIGANGRGKTTLIKLLAGCLEPDSGKIERGHNVEICYFPQNHQEVVDKASGESSFDWLKARKPNAYDQDIRGVLGKMLFGGDDAFKPVSALSGGETARLILAEMMLVEHNFLILDEPNNHLDLEAVSALAWGLNDYQGTVVVVSHGRDLIEKVATKIISFEKDGIKIYHGGLTEYLEAR